MTNQDAPSQSDSEIQTSSQTLQSGNSSNVDARVCNCEKLLNIAIEQSLPATVFADSLKDLGLKAFEASTVHHWHLDAHRQRRQWAYTRVPG